MSDAIVTSKSMENIIDDQRNARLNAYSSGPVTQLSLGPELETDKQSQKAVTDYEVPSLNIQLSKYECNEAKDQIKSQSLDNIVVNKNCTVDRQQLEDTSCPGEDQPCTRNQSVPRNKMAASQQPEDEGPASEQEKSPPRRSESLATSSDPDSSRSGSVPVSSDASSPRSGSAPMSSDASSPMHTFHSVAGTPSTVHNSPVHQYHSVQGTPSTFPNSPSHMYHSPCHFPNSPTHQYHSVDGSDVEDLNNENSYKATERLYKTKERLLREEFNEISRAPDGQPPASASHKRRSSKTSAHSRTHSRSHSRRVSDISDIDLPPLEPLFGPHLYFHPEEETTPDENDLFPSTPLDEEQLAHADSKLQEQLGSLVINTIEEEELPEEIGWLDPRWLDPRPLMYNAAEQAEEFAMTVWHKFQSWKVVQFTTLPQWLQDNDFLKKGHRPPLPSFRECFKSIFRIHTETGNIWTHLLGVVAFMGLAVYFITRPVTEIETQEKMVFMSFFAGAIVCLGLSFTFHTVCCHQNKFIGKLFAKLDYCGIAFLTVGSFVPWLYYSFYCHYTPKVVYLSICIVLGILAVVVSLWDKFGTPRYRPFRAGVFVVFGLSGIAPATHYGIVNGWEKSMNEAAMGWLVLMGLLYITGAMLYAFRIPERIFPGKVDILFHSHQLFHCFVIAGAFVHYHGISNMALYRLQIGECRNSDIDLHQYTSFITLKEL